MKKIFLCVGLVAVSGCKNGESKQAQDAELLDAAGTDKIWECAGYNKAEEDAVEAGDECEGYFRLYLYGTSSQELTKAMIYPNTSMNSGQTWQGQDVLTSSSLGFKGVSKKGQGNIDLKITLNKMDKLKLKNQSCLPEKVQNLTGNVATLNYVSVYQLTYSSQPPKRVVGKNLDIVCRKIK